MKKILFSLAALAAISLVAAGCKKASDAAKPKAEPEMKEITAVKTAFTELLDACDPAKCTTEQDVKKICGTGDPNCLVTKFETAVTSAIAANVTGIQASDLTDLKAKAKEDQIWAAKSSGSDKEVKLDKLNALKSAVKDLESKVNALKAPAKK